MMSKLGSLKQAGVALHTTEAIGASDRHSPWCKVSGGPGAGNAGPDGSFRSLAKDRPPSRTGLPPSSRRRCAATRRNGPNEMAGSPPVAACGSITIGSAQLAQKLFRRDKIGSSETLGEAIVDWLKAGGGVSGTALIVQQAGEARGRAQLP